MISIKDVAKRAGVSVGTVSNVINRPESVSPAMRAKVTEAITALGYVRSESARQLRAQRSRVMAMLVLDLSNPFFVEVARGAEQAARESGLAVMVCNSDQDSAREAEYLSLFAEHRVHGVLVTPSNLKVHSLPSLSRQGIPYVFVDRMVPSEQACSVGVDDVTGGRLAVAHLINSGHERIVYVSGPLSLPQCADRGVGARQAVAEAGLPESALTVIEVPKLDVSAGRDAGSRLLGLQSRPTAVFCVNDLVALGLLQALFGAGLRVPEDMAIVGYDDIEFTAAAAVPLTSVRQPMFKIGYTAAKLLIEKTSVGSHTEHIHERVVYQPELVVRASSMRRPR